MEKVIPLSGESDILKKGGLFDGSLNLAMDRKSWEWNMSVDTFDRKSVSIFVADEYASAFDTVDNISDSGFASKAFTELGSLRIALNSAPFAVLFVGATFDPAHDTIDLIAALKYEASTHNRVLIVILVTDDTDTSLVMAAARAGAFRTMKKSISTGLLKIIIEDAFAEVENDSTKLTGKHVESAMSVSETSLKAPPIFPADSSGSNGEGAEGGNVIAPPQPVEEGSPLDNVSEKGKQLPQGDGDEQYLARDGIDDGHRYPMDRMIVLNNVPDEPGIITFYDEDEQPLMIEWAGNLNQRLNYYVDLHPALSEVARKAKTFDILSTMDKEQEAKIFDRLTNKFGRYPLLMKEAPAGSSHYGHAPDSLHKDEVDAGRITHYTHTNDTKMLDGIKSLLAKNPESPETQDWLAFTLYSNNLLDEAIEWYTKLITKGSRREEHFFYCGNAFFKKGQVDKALKLWTVSAKIKPHGAIARKSKLRIAQVTQGKPSV